jgi:hypothetical protein
MDEAHRLCKRLQRRPSSRDRVLTVLSDTAATSLNPTATALRNYASFLLEVCNEAVKGEQFLSKADAIEEAAAKSRVRGPGGPGAAAPPHRPGQKWD